MEETSRMDMFDLRGKVAVVVGGCGLLGHKFCLGLADHGADVVIADVEEEKAVSFSSTISEHRSVKAFPLLMDVTSDTSVSGGLELILREFGRVDVLVLSAYPKTGDWSGPLLKESVDSVVSNIEMQLGGCFRAVKTFAGQMIDQEAGNIINIGSIYGILGPDFRIYEGTDLSQPAEYSMIKGGIINFTRYLATYLAPYNIRANCISPGGVRDLQPEEFIDNYSDRVPLGRMAYPEELVGGLVYLASDASSYVTGHNLVIDGGWSAW